MKLCIFFFMNVGAYLGWLAGERVGLMTAFIASGIGSIVGIYCGWRLARALLD